MSDINSSQTPASASRKSHQNRQPLSIGSRETDDDSQDSLAEKPYNEPKTTPFQSFLHLVKGYVGPGCLSLPWAVSQLGIVSGILCCWIIALWSSYNCWIVVRIKRDMMETTHPATSIITYPEVAQWLCGSTIRIITQWSIVVQQLAICSVFLSFFGTNLQAVLLQYGNDHISHVTVITLALPAVLSLSCLPNLKALAPITVLGTVFLLSGLFVLGVVLTMWDEKIEEQDTASTDEESWLQVPLAICAVLYSYEGICLILPVEGSMHKARKHFGTVFVLAMTTAGTIFSIVAGFSVARLGQVSNGSITAFLLEQYHSNGAGSDSDLLYLILLANALVSFSVLVTYPLQLFPVVELLEHQAMAQSSQAASCQDEVIPLSNESDLSDQGDRGKRDEVAGDSEEIFQDEPHDLDQASAKSISSMRKFLTRTGLVFVTYLVAVAVPNVQSLISLAGALAGSSVALVIPPILDIAWIRKDPNKSTSHRGSLVLGYVLLTKGVFFLCVGTGAAAVEIVRSYTNK